MKYFYLATLLMASSFAQAETCYQISNIQGAWSKTPELVCIEQADPNQTAEITLKSGLSFNERVLAVFNLDLLVRAKCIDCNQDTYGLSNPSNSSFNALSIKFDGVKNIQTMMEKGTIHIGNTKFYYRSL